MFDNFVLLFVVDELEECLLDSLELLARLQIVGPKDLPEKREVDGFIVFGVGVLHLISINNEFIARELGEGFRRGTPGPGQAHQIVFVIQGVAEVAH